MGIAVQELLANDFFKDFEVIAGHKGLHKEIQGITILEAPDGFNWTKGKEMVLTSGYVFVHNPNVLNDAFAEGKIQRSSGLMVKRDRYVDKIPDEICQLFDENELPLISVPFSVPWMDIISQANVAVMNRTIMKFRMDNVLGQQITKQSYKENKIRKILKSVESEMKFPALLYDCAEEKSYYSSSNFSRMTEHYGLKESDYWEPSLPYTHHTLCDYINMSRYRLIHRIYSEGPRISWVKIPIIVGGVTQAYFVVMEARSSLDYYDEFAVRIAYLMLQSLYEQISVARDAGFMGFENFIHFALSCSDEDVNKVISQASVQGISMSISYNHALIRLENINVNAERSNLIKAFQLSGGSKYGKFIILDESHLLILFEIKESMSTREVNIKQIIKSFFDQIIDLVPETKLVCGICKDGKTLRDIKGSVDKCQRVINMGHLIYPEKTIFDYEMIGPMTWLDIPAEDLEIMLEKFRRLLEDDKGRELVRTLKIYLESNMNFSTAADRMFVHINTIRKRIDKINGLLNIDWDNPVERVNTIILLQLLGLE